MKNVLMWSLLASFLSSSVYAAQTIPGYNYNGTYLRMTGGNGKSPGWPKPTNCNISPVSLCTNGFITVAESSDLAALEKKVFDQILGTKNDLINAQSETSKALMESDELKEAIRAIVREEIKKALEK